MGGINNCCCEEESCCVTLSGMPTIVVAGETLDPTVSGDWLPVSDCCYKTRIVDLASETWNEVKSSLIAFDERSGEVYHDVYVNDNKKQTVPGSYNPVTVVADVQALVDNGTVTACEDDPYLCNTFHELIESRREEFLIARWRRKSIETYIFKALAETAADDGPVCRWFVVSKLTIEYQSAQVNTTSEHHEKDVGVDACCVGVNIVSHDITAATDATLYASIAGDTPSEFVLYSAKTYLTLPTGTTAFTPGDTVTATFSTTPCISVTNAATQGTVTSTSPSGFPYAWTDPSISTSSAARSLCQVAITWDDSPGDGCALRAFSLPTTSNFEWDVVAGGPGLPGTHWLQLFAVFNGTTLPPAYVTIDASCSELCFGSTGGTWFEKTIVKSDARDLTFAHTFQNEIVRTISIAPGPWSILF